MTRATISSSGFSSCSEALKQQGFTLMELIGAMAIIAILAAVLAPSVTDGIDRAYATAEEDNLRTLVGALEQEVLVNKRIPRQNTADWTATVAAYADLPIDQVAFNARGHRRALYVDPQFFSATETTFPGYQQTTGLSSRPFSPRLMLVSSLNGNAPAAPRTAADFAAIWDQTGGAAVVEGPKVKVERLNLAGHFHRVLLSNANTQQPAYALETGGASPVPAAVSGVDGSLIRYVLRSTRLAVFFAPFPSGGVNTSTLVSGEVSYHYVTDGTRWYWERS
ncbi:MAG: prepilin-type N-terminal cleavage/methylation domain-containing protein [Pseudomonadota bacterium]